MTKTLEPEKVGIKLETFKDAHGRLGVQTAVPLWDITNHVVFEKPDDSSPYVFTAWECNRGLKDIQPKEPIFEENEAFTYAEEVVREYIQKNWKN